MLDSNKIEQHFAWFRYLYWADLACREWDRFTESEDEANKWVYWWGTFARMSHFYATEYVVVEGWREAKFADAVIDEALNRWPDLLDLLRRYRNGAFHYQPKIVESKFTQFLKESEESLPLVYNLHSEFCRYYWFYIDSFPCPSEQRAELRQSFLDIVGWIPDELIEARAADLHKVANDAVILTKGHNGPQADAFRNAVQKAHLLGERQVVKYREMCRAFLSRNAK